MYRYQPPKSSVWGHRLGKTTTTRTRELFQQFLTRSVGEFSFGTASLSFTADAVPSWLREQLLLVANGNQWSLNHQQSDRCVEILIEWERRHPRPASAVALAQLFNIHEWRAGGKLIPTNSTMQIHYGVLPCLSTFLQFDAIETFEHVRDALLDTGLCKLNPKHLKPVRKRGARPSETKG